MYENFMEVKWMLTFCVCASSFWLRFIIYWMSSELQTFLVCSAASFIISATPTVALISCFFFFFFS